MKWCEENQKDFLPVVYPGFSRLNYKREEKEFNSVPRSRGHFLEKQYKELNKLKVNMVFQGMFDEIDEGTAVFKCTPAPPIEARFIDLENLPSDFYLNLVKSAKALIFNHISLAEFNTKMKTLRKE